MKVSYMKGGFSGSGYDSPNLSPREKRFFGFIGFVVIVIVILMCVIASNN